MRCFLTLSRSPAVSTMQAASRTVTTMGYFFIRAFCGAPTIRLPTIRLVL